MDIGRNFSDRLTVDDDEPVKRQILLKSVVVVVDLNRAHTPELITNEETSYRPCCQCVFWEIFSEYTVYCFFSLLTTFFLKIILLCLLLCSAVFSFRHSHRSANLSRSCFFFPFLLPSDFYFWLRKTVGPW